MQAQPELRGHKGPLVMAVGADQLLCGRDTYARRYINHYRAHTVSAELLLTLKGGKDNG